MEILQPYIISIIAILLLTAFIKCLTVFSILRYGLGFTGSGIGIVLIAISLALSLMIMAPQVEDQGGLDKIFSANYKSIADLDRNFSPILKRYTDTEILDRFTSFAIQLKNKSIDAADEKKLEQPQTLNSETSFMVLAASYLLTEIRRAFEVGLFLLIPFLVLDLIVANVLMLLGINNIQQVVIALPLKLLLFFLVDGWSLLSTKLISDYF